jgi:hypothetical protein
VTNGGRNVALNEATNLGLVVTMAETALPEDVERFLVQHVATVAQLEAIILLRAAPERPWSTSSLAEALFIDARRATQIVTHLRDHGFVTESRNGELRYCPSPALAREVDVVAETYRARLVAVSQFIHARQDAVSIRGFADAFRFRKG